MTPDRAFRLTDVAAMRAFAADRAFAHLLAVSDGRPVVAHAPVTLTPAGHLRFHLARQNPAAARMDGAAAIASIAGHDAYVSPDWYVSRDQVPTWNYVAVEAEGVVRRLDPDETIAQLDELSAAHEARLLPKRPWTRDKMGPGRFEAMLGGLVGFELVVAEWRGTAKLSQNKPAADRAGVIEGYRRTGRADMAGRVAAAK